MKHTGASIERVGNGKVFLVKDSPWRGGSAVVARDMILEVDANPTVLMEKLMSRHSVGKSQVNIEKSQMKAEESQVNIEKSQVKVVKKQVRFLESQVKVSIGNPSSTDLADCFFRCRKKATRKTKTCRVDTANDRRRLHRDGAPSHWISGCHDLNIPVLSQRREAQQGLFPIA